METTAEPIEHLLNRIEEVLGHPIHQKDFFVTALTHRSYANEHSGQGLSDNERMEFLGDAVLQLTVSSWLMDEFPEESEGTLSRYRSTLVNERSLAKSARKIDLGPFLRLGKGEEVTQGRKKDSLLANAFEALLCAIFQEGGIGDVETFIRFSMRDLLENVEKHYEKHDYKTMLQEFTQRVHNTTPTYHLVLEEGPDHSKTFESEVQVNAEVYGRGRAKSKKASEQQAAHIALQSMRAEKEEKKISKEDE